MMKIGSKDSGVSYKACCWEVDLRHSGKAAAKRDAKKRQRKALRKLGKKLAEEG